MILSPRRQAQAELNHAPVGRDDDVSASSVEGPWVPEGLAVVWENPTAPHTRS